jgi:predicted  nucleic acid-binding Zn-ribbon protein
MVNRNETVNQFVQQQGEHKTFFKSNKEELEKADTLANDVNLLSRRVRVIEDRYNNLRRKTQVDEQNVLNINKKLTIEVKTLNTEFNELKSELSDIKNKILQIIEELKKCAKKEELKVVQKYVEIWQPLNFVTRKEVEKLIKEIMEKI